MFKHLSLPNFDWPLLVASMLVTLIGVASMWDKTVSISQSVYLGIGVLALLWMASKEYRTYKSYIYILFYASLAALFLLLFVGSVRNGTRGWFDFGLFTIQPSEFAKPVYIIALATYFSHQVHHTIWQIIQSLSFVIPISILILLEPDFGTMVVYLAIWIIFILALRLRTKLKIGFVSLGLLLGALSVISLLVMLPDGHFQKARLITYPEHLLLVDKPHPDIGYQVDQAIIGVASGGLTGKGWLNGSQTRLGFIPESHTDFIFASIAEEFGFLGACVILILYGIILIRTLTIAYRAPDEFGRLIAMGIFGMFFYHILQCVGMTLGLLPVTGIPLTLLSAGGSNLIAAYICLGALQSIYISTQKQLRVS